MRDNQKHVLTTVLTLSVLIVAFFRGNQLLGAGAGIVYTILSGGTCFLLVTAFCTKRKTNRFGRVFIAIFAVAIFAIGNFPAQFSPALGSFVEIRQQEIENNRLLRKILTTDPGYENLEFESIRWKCVVYVIRGELDSDSDLNELRHRIFSQCPGISQRWLYWKLIVKESGKFYDECDLAIFGELPELAG